MSFEIVMELFPTGKVDLLLFGLYSNFAIFSGATSYRYDFRSRQYRSTPWTQLIAGISNLIVLTLVPFDIYRVCSQDTDWDMATELTVRLDTLVNDVACLMRVVMRLPRESATNKIAHELQSLESIYSLYDIRDNKMEEQLHQVFLAKNCLLWVFFSLLWFFMMLSYDVYDVELETPVFGRLLMTIYVMILDGQEMTMHMHFLITWRICLIYMRLNNRISYLLKGRREVGVISELHCMRRVHMKLERIMQRLNVTYNYMLISSRLSLIVTAASLGYYITRYRDQDNGILFLVCSVFLFVIIAISCYTLDLLYDVIIKCQRYTRQVLWECISTQSAPEELFRGSELFMLQVACFPLEVRPYGLFHSGRKTWLSNLVCILSWSAFLLQYRMLAKA